MTSVAVVVLAAGDSSRFGTDNKLLAQFDGKPLVAHLIDSLSQLLFVQRIAVLNDDAGLLKEMFETGGFDIAINDKAKQGMGASIAAGIGRVGGADGAMIVLGDMPYIDVRTLKKIQAEFARNSQHRIVAPVFAGQRGHPVIFARSLFDELRLLTGDQGAKSVIEGHGPMLTQIPVDDRGVLMDVDTPADIRLDQA